MCVEKIAKIILIAINIVFFIGGFVILAVAIVCIVKVDLIYKLTGLLTGIPADIILALEIVSMADLELNYKLKRFLVDILSAVIDKVPIGLLVDKLIPCYAMIVTAVGSFLFVLGFLGCYGAMRKSAFKLNLYANLIVAILIVEVCLGVYAYVFSDNLEAKIQDGMKISLSKYYVKGIRFDGEKLDLPGRAQDLAWDAVQLEAICCGVTNYSNWKDANKWKTTYEYNSQVIEAVLPPSCCKRTEAAKDKDIMSLVADDFEDIENCTKSAKNGTFNEVPCYDRLREIVFSETKITISVIVIVVLIEVVAIACAYWLNRKAESRCSRFCALFWKRNGAQNLELHC